MKLSFSLDDLQLFHRLVQNGSLRAAADATGIPLATISRRLKSLERDLGCRLLERSAHHFSLTDMGRHYYDQCGPLLDDLQSIANELEIDQHELSGLLKITAPVNLTQQWLGRCFFDFMMAYPKIRLQLVLSNHYENLVEQQFDAAFRVGSPRDNNWIARHVWTRDLGLCASSQYLATAAAIEHPRDLLKHHLIVADPIDTWELTHTDSGETFSLAPQAHLRTSDIIVAMDAAAAHLGITLVPDYYFSDPKSQRQPLQAVLPAWRGQKLPVNLLYRDREVMSARLRTFIDFVLQWMEARAPSTH